MRREVAGWVAVFCATMSGAPPARECGNCHAAEAKLHAKTRMAQAMSPALSSAFVENLPDQPLRESGDGYAFTYQRTAGGVSVTAMRRSNQAEGVIEWVLGAGAQGQTPLVRTAEGMRESRVSYFPQLHQYGITVGQDGGASANAQAALGLKTNAKDLRTCLGCHSSAITSDLHGVRRVRVGGLVEAEVAVADLHEAEAVRRGLGAADQPRAGEAAGDGPHHRRARPGHAPQRRAAVEDHFAKHDTLRFGEPPLSRRRRPGRRRHWW
jgi:cytochrome c553